MARSVRTARAARIIESADDVAEGARALRRKCPHMRAIWKATGDPPVRRREPGFEGLARIVVGQQLSVASAAAIWKRVEEAIRPFTAERVLALTEEQLRGAGLSRPKVRTLVNLATAVAEGRVAMTTLVTAPDEHIHEQLTAVNGIGPWTADIFLMFCLGRADSFAAGDLALQEAVRLAMALEERPGAAELAEIAERWRPWRGVAALMLWEYYRVVKTLRQAQPA